MILKHQVQRWTHTQITQIIFRWNQRYQNKNQNRASMQTIRFSKNNPVALDVHSKQQTTSKNQQKRQKQSMIVEMNRKPATAIPGITPPKQCWLGFRQVVSSPQDLQELNKLSFFFLSWFSCPMLLLSPSGFSFSRSNQLSLSLTGHFRDVLYLLQKMSPKVGKKVSRSFPQVVKKWSLTIHKMPKDL